MWQTLCDQLKRVNAGDAPNNFLRVLEGESPCGRSSLVVSHARVFACSNMRMCAHTHIRIGACMLTLTRWPLLRWQLHTPAAAMDHHMHFSGSNSVEMAYQSTPVLRANDYEVLRSLGRWLPGKPPNADFVYFMCVSPAGVLLPPEDVIGVTHASFYFVVPSESMLLTIATPDVHE